MKPTRTVQARTYNSVPIAQAIRILTADESYGATHARVVTQWKEARDPRRPPRLRRKAAR